ncbi:YdcF family protein [Sphingomonas ginkgonis]|uniref:YdcF family protein n=1 Tax=Sphingomonas ginkgonis TaxID=2315330 RepID=A0A429V7C0_9SPHN|nr:YdcF family protein [Sphingomonas ginkgonis]RST29777.1 YdcF family protein [Sphingomonas ginkgonis]
MILRLGAFLLLLFALGFALFTVTLGTPAPAGTPAADAIVVLTGGSGRIERGMAMLAAGKAPRMLIAGADPSVTKADLLRRLHGKGGRLIACCVDLGSESVDTRSNAEEAKRWLDRGGYKSVWLITSDWHMRRSAYEFRRHLGSRTRIVTDAVPTEPSLTTLFGEYSKYVLRRLAVWLDV